MLKEFFESVRGFVTDQARVTPTIVEGIAPSKRKKAVWNPHSKSIELFERERPDNQHSFLDLDSVVRYVSRMSDKDETNIWVHNSGVTVECRENDPKDVVSMTFTYSPMFVRLQNLVKAPSLKQPEAIKLLRQQFADFDPSAKALAAVRSLKIHTTSDDESDQSALAARIGKSVMQQAVGADALPDRIVVKTPVYVTSTTVHDIDVFLAVDFRTSASVLFEPNESMMQTALDTERKRVADYFSEQFKSVLGVNVYQGGYSVAS